MKFDIRPISQKWFSESTPVNFKVAKAVITGDANKKLTIFAKDATTSAEIEIVLAETSKASLSASFSDDVLTITLGTTNDEEVTADDTKNTLKAIADKINATNIFTASYEDAGADVVDTPTVTSIEFTDGNYGTPCMEAGVGFKTSEYYYVCTVAENSIYNAGWRRFTVSDY